MIIEDLCKEGIAFASFGTNDLTQLVLGIDRNNEKLAHLSSEFHPAVLRSIEMVIKICNSYGIETSICGESGSNPNMAKILLRYGIKSISCNIDAIDMIREVVHQEEEEEEEGKNMNIRNKTKKTINLE
jgi:pyruvate,water dikinase